MRLELLKVASHSQIRYLRTPKHLVCLQSGLHPSPHNPADLLSVPEPAPAPSRPKARMARTNRLPSELCSRPVETISEVGRSYQAWTDPELRLSVLVLPRGDSCACCTTRLPPTTQESGQFA